MNLRRFDHRPVYLDIDVVEAALKRIHWLFDVFEHVVVNFSGGKDSSVVLDLALRVAQERGRLPLDVVFIDQEAEWQGTVELARRWHNDERVRFFWGQFPMRIFNASSIYAHWLRCWGEDRRQNWMRDKEPYSHHSNDFGTERLMALFSATARYLYPQGDVVVLTGVRIEESPKRRRVIFYTPERAVKGEMWVRRDKHNTYKAHVIYDWLLGDVWRYIYERQVPYNSIYDKMFQLGLSLREMRVSNLHHEYSIANVQHMMRLEPETYIALARALQGTNAAYHLKEALYKAPERLPYMFSSWRDYRDYLLEYLVEDERAKERFKALIASIERRFGNYPKIQKALVEMILNNDFEGVTLANARLSVNVGKRSLEEKARYAQKAQ